MDDDNRIHIKEYLSNINVGISNIGYQKVWPEWRDIDYIPNYNKFYFICDGEGWLKIDGIEYYPKPGQMFLMPKGVKQSYSSINSNTFTKYWCHFTAQIGDMNLFEILSVPCFIDVEDCLGLEKLFMELIKYNQSLELESALKVKAVILEIISFYLKNTTIQKINLHSSDTIERLNMVINYIDENLTETITVEELAKIVHLHPNYFIRLFKKHLGTSPINYINRRRVENAKIIMEKTDDTLGSIASKVGISDAYYLSKVFKEHTGFSPMEYKKIIRQ